mmetsp:Transcript_6033/g.14477  ORF Transcript_6033/g.14477 Transcript_6033/m.14477 type:complete len:134 (-) Transcript_6033:106-507(-)
MHSYVWYTHRPCHPSIGMQDRHEGGNKNGERATLSSLSLSPSLPGLPASLSSCIHRHASLTRATCCIDVLSLPPLHTRRSSNRDQPKATKPFVSDIQYNIICLVGELATHSASLSLATQPHTHIHSLDQSAGS